MKILSKFKIIVLIIPIIIVLATLFLIYFPNQFKSCEGLNCLKFSNINKYKLSEIYQSDTNSFRGLYVNNNEQIRIGIKKNIRPENAEKETSIMITQMKKLYEKERSPYPGEITEAVVCADEFVPNWKSETVNGIEMNYTTAFLNDRLVYGACTEEQLRYESLFMTFYCRDQEKLYQLEIITDKNNFSTYRDKYFNLMGSLKCM